MSDSTGQAAPPAGVMLQGPQGVVLQDWTALPQCLDFQLGQMGFQQRGAQAFTTQEVPNLINQGGLSAYRAAEVLFAHCVEVDAAGQLEREIAVMEMAIGLGLFALQLLDRFQKLCVEHGRDYYDRLTYYATDGTPRMIEDARANGVFDRHAGRVVLGLVNALDPARLVRLDDGQVVDLTGRLRAVFHTYLLCVLPAHIFRRQRVRLPDGSEKVAWGVVMARTVLKHPEQLPHFTPLTVQQVQQIAASQEAGALQPLVPLYPLMDLELALANVDVAELEDAAELERLAEITAAGVLEGRKAAARDVQGPDAQVQDTQGQDPQAQDTAKEPPDPRDDVWVLHSAGAMHSLQRTLEVLRKDGLLLYRDYGPATAERANGNHLYQHYGATTAFGLNHFGLDSWLLTPGPDGQPRAFVTVPDGEGEASIKTRLVTRADLPRTRDSFRLQFDPRAFDALEQAVNVARNQLNQPGNPMDAYRRALQMERDNWVLLGEAGEIALRRMKQMDLAHMLLTEALRINPWYATTTWNNLGDLFWAAGDVDQAQAAYERAVKANPEYYRGYLNLADCWRLRGDWSKALELAAMALARDVDGTEHERAKAAVDDSATRLKAQRELAASLRKQRQAGTLR